MPSAVSGIGATIENSGALVASDAKSGKPLWSFQTNALSSTFGQWLTAQPKQQGEVAIRMMF